MLAVPEIKKPLALHTQTLIYAAMNLIRIYECLCDETRLRILQLLTVSPLCVCHLQSILEKPQVKISQHLAYLKKRGMVVTDRRKQWMVYSLPTERTPELETNLKCLQDCATTEPIFADDLARLRQVIDDPQCQAVLSSQSAEPTCC